MDRANFSLLDRANFSTFTPGQFLTFRILGLGNYINHLREKLISSISVILSLYALLAKDSSTIDVLLQLTLGVSKLRFCCLATPHDLFAVDMRSFTDFQPSLQNLVSLVFSLSDWLIYWHHKSMDLLSLSWTRSSKSPTDQHFL